ncbi:MAG: RNA ligase [Thermodesulfovibrionales bacterium]
MSISYLPFLTKYLTDENLSRLRERDILHTLSYNELTFVRLSQEYKAFPRGTVFYEDGFIPGYPRIMRVLHLQKGIDRYLKDSFYVEEKVDGYNVRIGIINGTPIAFTRGGFICPFTTDRVPDLIDLNFFRNYPKYIICGEVVGPGSPYNTEVIPYVNDDVVFFAFDIIDDRGMRLSAEERYSILGHFDIPQIRRWGPFRAADIDTVKEIVLDLDRDGREGIVIKPISAGRPIKFVTISSCLRDLQATTGLMTELPAGFYIQRILRAIFFSHEFGIPINERYLMESARALYLAPHEALREVAGGGSIRESFEIKVRNKNTVYELLRHLSRSGVLTQLISIERIDDYYRARFHRIYINGTRELRHRLMGRGFFD